MHDLTLKNSSSDLAKIFSSANGAFQYCAGAYQDYLNKYDPKNRDDLVARLFNERTILTEKHEPIPFHVSEEGIIEEVTNLLFAGTDTTGNKVIPDNGANGRTQFSVRNSRLAFSLEAPEMDSWKSKGYFEFDLLGFDPTPGANKWING